MNLITHNIRVHVALLLAMPLMFRLACRMVLWGNVPSDKESFRDMAGDPLYRDDLKRIEQIFLRCGLTPD